MAAMFQDKYVFSQLTAFLNRTQFNNYVRKYDGNRYVKHFTCWNQMLAMMFGQSLFMPRNTSMASSTPLAAGAARSLSTSRNCGA